MCREVPTIFENAREWFVGSFHAHFSPIFSSRKIFGNLFFSVLKAKKPANSSFLIDWWKNLWKFCQKLIILIIFGTFWAIFDSKIVVFSKLFLQPKWPFLALFCCFSEKIAIPTPYDHVILETFFAVLVAVFAKMAFFRLSVHLVGGFEKKPKSAIFLSKNFPCTRTFFRVPEKFSTSTEKLSTAEERDLDVSLTAAKCFYPESCEIWAKTCMHFWQNKLSNIMIMTWENYHDKKRDKNHENGRL